MGGMRGVHVFLLIVVEFHLFFSVVVVVVASVAVFNDVADVRHELCPFWWLRSVKV